jgi:hypothetical protein
VQRLNVITPSQIIRTKDKEHTKNKDTITLGQSPGPSGAHQNKLIPEVKSEAMRTGL